MILPVICKPRTTKLLSDLLKCAYYGCVFPKGRILSTSQVSWILTLTLVSSLAFGQTNPCEKAYDFQADIDRWTKVLEKDPTNVTALVCHGIAYQNAQKPVLARKDFETAIGLEPTSAKAHRARGNLEVTLGRYEQGVADLSKAIQFDPAADGAYYDRGRAYQLTDRPRLALTDFRTSCELLEENYLAFVGVGNVYVREREKDIGALWINRAIEILDRKISEAAPGKCNSYLYKARGHAALTAYRLNDAFRDLNETVSQDPRSYEAFYFRAWLYNAISALDHSLTDINRSIELNPFRVESYNFRAKLYDRLSNKQAAEADRAKIKELGELK